STVSPGLIRLPCIISAAHAVTAAQGRVAASSNERPAGIATTPSSSSPLYSASVQSTGTPPAGSPAPPGPSFPACHHAPHPPPPQRAVTGIPSEPGEATPPAPSDSGIVGRATAAK